MLPILSSSGKVLDEIHLFIQFVIGIVSSSFAILIIFAVISPSERFYNRFHRYILTLIFWEE